jgi:hypothetical protein
LAAGADANVKDNYGRTSVWRGALQSTAEILQLLIDGGSSVNESDNYGLTPLIVLACTIAGTIGVSRAGLGCRICREDSRGVGGALWSYAAGGGHCRGASQT